MKEEERGDKEGGYRSKKARTKHLSPVHNTLINNQSPVTQSMSRSATFESYWRLIPAAICRLVTDIGPNSLGPQS